MKKFIVLFREPDGRMTTHPEEAMKEHQARWKNWFGVWSQAGNLEAGSGLKVEGRQIKGQGDIVLNECHRNGTEFVGGFLLLKAANLDEAVNIMRSCPVYEFGGYAEIREFQE